MGSVILTFELIFYESGCFKHNKNCDTEVCGVKIPKNLPNSGGCVKTVGTGTWALVERCR